MEKVYLSVGSNLGDRNFYLEEAKKLTGEIPGVHFLKSSSIFETDPVGDMPQGKFLNAVWEIETNLSPRDLKLRLREIEERLGRRRLEQNAPREIDLDILSYGHQLIDETDLKIPHPRLHERWFVLAPLVEIAPDWFHPLLRKTAKELLNEIARVGHAS